MPLFQIPSCEFQVPAKASDKDTVRNGSWVFLILLQSIRKMLHIIFFVQHLKPSLSATLNYQHTGKHGGMAGLYLSIKIIDKENCSANEFPIVLKATVLKIFVHMAKSLVSPFYLTHFVWVKSLDFYALMKALCLVSRPGDIKYRSSITTDRDFIPCAHLEQHLDSQGTLAVRLNVRHFKFETVTIPLNR